jgi:hypothetical protein
LSHLPVREAAAGSRQFRPFAAAAGKGVSSTLICRS